MQTSFLSITLPGEKLYQYLVVVHPDNDVSGKIQLEKQLFDDEFKETIAVKTKPHIKIASFIARESMEETLIRWIQRICNLREQFTVTLNNYSGFPPDTIYIRVQNEKPFQQLVKELKILNTYVSSCSCPPVKLISRPYVSIARRVSEEVYFKALSRYSLKSFHETFMVNELLLLRRENQFDCGKAVSIFGLPPGNTLFN